MELKKTNDKYRFRCCGKLYTLPSELYPLVHTEEIYDLHSSNMDEITDDELLSIINSRLIRVGNQIEDTEKLYEDLVEAGYEAYFWAGWLFLGESLPVWHCWVVVMSEHNDEDRFHLVDCAFHKSAYYATERLFKKYRSSDTEIKRRKFAKYMRIELSQSENDKKIITGKPLPHMVYVGNSCSSRQALEISKKLKRKVTHPSYRGQDDWNNKNTYYKFMT